MQKLLSDKVNTPLDASQVQCNCGLQLNKDKILYPKLEPSVANTKTSTNNLEVNLPVQAEPLPVRSEILRGRCNPFISNLVSSTKLKISWFSPEGFYKI